MAKIDLSDSKSLFDKAIGYSNAAERDQDDPASANLLMALHNYFQSTATSLIAIAKAVETMSDRLERLERNAAGPLSTKLK
ncbi:MAG: hypothetical protein QM698_03185 [Micropepsaceae bacterium]